MHRCFIEQERWNETRMIPSAEEAHHIRHVLRARDGDALSVFNGSGIEARARLRASPSGGVVLEVEALLPATARRFELTLIQAVLKGNRMDMLIEKATELGVSCIVPIITDRVVVRLDCQQLRKKTERWERIAVSAAKQCGTQWLPVIAPAASMEAAMHAAMASGPLLLASLAGNPRPLGNLIADWREGPPPAAAVMIGPEGDFTASETGGALAAGALPVSLGNLTLRAETAAIYATSALACAFMWTDSPPPRRANL